MAGCSFLMIEYLSIYRDKRDMKRFTPKDILYEQNKDLYDMFLEHKGRHAYTYLPNRESRTFNFKGFINCDLTNKKKDFYVRFGFDYYMYFNSNIDKCILKKRDREKSVCISIRNDKSSDKRFSKACNKIYRK